MNTGPLNVILLPVVKQTVSMLSVVAPINKTEVVILVVCDLYMNEL